MGGNVLKNRIKVQRAIKDWTQEELAHRVGVTRKTINTIENGVYIPSTYLAMKIAKAFGTTVEDVFQFAEDTVNRESDRINVNRR